MNFSELVKKHRVAKYSTAKEFYYAAGLNCSYFYYSKVESGTVPTIDLTLEIINKLDINIRNGLFSWARSQMPTKDTQAIFAELEDTPSRSDEQMSVARSLVVNRNQAELLKKDPIYWELILIISSHYKIKRFTASQLAKEFNLTLQKIEFYLKNLYDFALIDKEKDKYFSKEWVFIPDSEEFESLRDSNFRRAFEQLWKVKNRYRTTVTRHFTKSQVKEVEAFIASLVNQVIDMSDDKAPPECAPHTLGVFFSRRKYGE